MKKVKDHYYHKAKQEGYVARSAYKLEEIDKKHHLFKSGNWVLDLGCCPGSWLQYAIKKVGNQGNVLGVDIQEVKLNLPAHAKVIQADIFELTAEDLQIGERRFDVIMSDMAPKTTGIRQTDALRSHAMNQQVLLLAEDLLKPNGTLLVKAFQGAPMDQLKKEFKNAYSQVKPFKPKSSRSESVEIFLLGLGKKDTPLNQSEGVENLLD